jgi:hypothetical protein
MVNKYGALVGMRIGRGNRSTSPSVTLSTTIFLISGLNNSDACGKFIKYT